MNIFSCTHTPCYPLYNTNRTVCSIAVALGVIGTTIGILALLTTTHHLPSLLVFSPLKLEGSIALTSCCAFIALLGTVAGLKDCKGQTNHLPGIPEPEAVAHGVNHAFPHCQSSGASSQSSATSQPFPSLAKHKAASMPATVHRSTATMATAASAPPIQLTEFFLALCKTPYQFSDLLRFDYKNETTVIKVLQPCWSKFKNLILCPCSKMSSVFRVKIEAHSIQLLQKQHPNTQLPITLVSLGSGGCYQELVYIAKLVQAGFQRINVVLIERDRSADVLAAEQALTDLCSQNLEFGVVNITHYPNLGDYAEAAQSNPSLQPNLLLLLDLSDDQYKTADTQHQKLYAYAFRFLKEKNVLKQGTIINYSDLDLDVRYPSENRYCISLVYSPSSWPTTHHALESFQNFVNANSSSKTKLLAS